MATQALLEYCRSREVLKDAQRRFQGDAKDNIEARRSLAELLKESMMRHNVECIELPDAQTFVRMSTPSRRVPPLRTAEEMSDVVRGVGAAASNKTRDDIPAAVTQYVAQQIRARVQDRPPPEARLSIVTQPVRHNTVRVASTSSEVRNLTEQYVRTCHATSELRRTVKPLKDAHRQHEANVLQTFEDPVSVRMQKNGAEIDLRVVRCQRKLRTTAPKPIGMRQFLSLCHDAAYVACGAADEVEEGAETKTFEDKFCDHLMAAVRAVQAQTPASSPQSYLKIFKLPPRKPHAQETRVTRRRPQK